MRQSGNALVMGDFEKLLPGGMTAASVRCGNEWVIPLLHITEAINIATENKIAVLGVEVFRISPHGFPTEGVRIQVWGRLGWFRFTEQSSGCPVHCRPSVR
jgi:hypothetical protein